MKAKKMTVFTGTILEDEAVLTFAELCWNCQASSEQVLHMVEQGVITPVQGRSQREWRFDRRALIRMDKAQRLQHDLYINPAGAALVLELLEEIDRLRAQLDRHINMEL